MTGFLGRPQWTRAWPLALTLTLAVLLAACTRATPPPAPAGVSPNQPELPAGGPTPGPELYPVIEVYDGDTIQVQLGGRREQVRLQGLNTPEESGPYREAECFGDQASAFGHQVLEGRQVRLAADPTQDDRDRYDRLLRYVWLDDGQFYNLMLLRGGYAHEYTYDRREPYQYQDAFRATEDEARAARRGLWSPETCGGSRGAPTVNSP